jgi:Protein of unknown function (DUF4012)
MLILLVLLGGTAVVAIGALGLREDLREGRASLEMGRRALFDGRIPEAVASLEDARDRFRSASTSARSGLPAVGGAIPILGRSLDVMRALADAGRRTAEAGLTIVTAIDQLPEGIEGLMSPEGVIAFDAMETVGGAVTEAEADVAAAVDTLRSSPAGLLPGPVGDARTLALGRLDELEELMGISGDLTTALPSLAGAEGPRRYLFFAEDPAELRGTGGIWGAFAIVRAEGGRFSFSRFRPIQTLPNLELGVVPPPTHEYLTNYGRYGAPGYWLNANMTPDLPSAAQVALDSWEAIGREPLDGVVTADPFALRDLLTVTGRIHVEIPPIDLTHENIVPLLSNRAFALFPDPVERKAVLGEAARAVLDRFLSIRGRTVPKLRALGRAVSEGHLKIFASDGSVGSALGRAGVDGSLDADGGDLLSVIVNSGSGGKVDFFSRRTIRHEVTLLPGRSSVSTTSVTIQNDAPASGQPKYVIGPHRGDAGDNIPLVALFCGRRCELVRAERDGERRSLREGSELGYRFYRDYFTIPSGRERTLEVTTESPGTWTGDTGGGSYRLTVVGQTTIRPTMATVVIHAPPGTRFTSWSDGVTVAGDEASWSGVLGDAMTFELSFERRPLLTRLWDALFGAG